MSFRVEVLEDGTIEIMRPNGLHTKFSRHQNLDSAMIVVKFLTRRDIEKARRERFVPQIQKEAQKAFKTLSERNPYHVKKR
ncbi:MAG: hypothetical protein QUT30_03115 [Acidobacteriota bacterium]|nr:hypothetical protein [Acidobacteriota bacterium]